MNGTSLVTFDSDGMAVSGSGDILIGIGSASLGTGKSLDVTCRQAVAYGLCQPE